MSQTQNTAQPAAKHNPLANYFRQPKIFFALPSKGLFYPEGALDISETGEYAVYAMTAKDELLLKTPDALLNGQATVGLIKSCIPAIRDPWRMPSIDIDAVLMAIRIATHGKDMEVSANCPNCSHHNEYVFDIVQYMNHLQTFQFQHAIDADPLIINIRPYTYAETTKATLKAIEQQKIFELVNNEQLSDQEKMEKFSSSFVKLTEVTVDVVCGCIASIETPEGTVDDQDMIKEFISNTNSEIFNKVNDHVKKMKNDIELKTQKVSCEDCQHEYEISITMDQSNFFAVRS
jgi:hypothetical protein